MILKASRIAELLTKGERSETEDPLVITPTPDIERLRRSGAASIDIRLGTWFVTLRQARMTHLEIDDAKSNSPLTKTHYVSFGDQYILHPRSFVLSVTLEWIRMPRSIAADVVGRSGWGRRGLVIATATGVHPGFTGCLTLELTNLGEIPIAIKPGMPICQLFLHSVEESGSSETAISQFFGSRKPKVGRVELDEFARKLAAANRRKHV